MTAQQLTDHELVTLYITGEEKALETLMVRHKDKVFTSIIMMVRDQQLAEDIFQDTFVKVINTLRSGNYKEEGKFLPWVMRIAYNLCIDHFRRVKRMPSITTTEGFDVFKTLRFVDESPDEKMHREESCRKVRQLIEQLPEDQKQVLVLRHYVELSFKEIADITGVSINTALGRMRYALINMRKLIKEKHVAI